MRLILLCLPLGVLACGSTVDTSDDSFGGAHSESTGGEEGLGSNSGGSAAKPPEGSGGTAPGSGGSIETGGSGGYSPSPDGGTHSGGSSGGAPASGGSSSSGGAPAKLDPCDPPALPRPGGLGNDQNGLCGWDLFNGAKPPEGYGSSAVSPVNCADPRRIVIPLVDDKGIRYSTWVEIIDPAARCTTGPVAGTDRRFTFSGDYCVKIASPFKGLTWDGFAVSGSCGVTVGTPVTADITISEQGWVKVETAELVSGQCPLSCE